MNEDYLKGVQAFYDGEVFGERLLLAMHAAARNARDAHHFATILQLETETKARLRPLLLKLGLRIDEDGADVSAIPSRLAGYVDHAWRDYAANTASHLAVVLARYEAIAALGPPEDQPVLRAVVRHEAALLAWARAEAAGEDDGSLEDIVSMLNFPVAPPRSETPRRA